jgi:hypothetical protein
LRTAKVEKQQTTFLHYRPAKDDVVVFSPGYDELRIHAATKGEKQLYRREFGLRLRDDANYFSERKCFTLEPLRQDGAGVLKWDGNGDVSRIVLREFELEGCGGRHDAIIQKADDIFASAAARGKRAFPDGGKLVMAGFDFYFRGMKQPRKVEVRPPNILKLGRHCDGALVQKWLSEMGFRETATAEEPNTPPFALQFLPVSMSPIVPKRAGLVLPVAEREK